MENRRTQLLDEYSENEDVGMRMRNRNENVDIGMRMSRCVDVSMRMWILGMIIT